MTEFSLRVFSEELALQSKRPIKGTLLSSGRTSKCNLESSCLPPTGPLATFFARYSVRVAGASWRVH